MVLAHSEDEVEDGDKDSDGIWVAPESEVAESDVVVSRDVACRYMCERGLLAQLDILHRLQSKREVSQQHMYPQQT